MNKSLMFYLSLLPIIFTFFRILIINETKSNLLLMSCSILIYVFINFDDIKELSFGKEGITLKREITKAQELNNELDKTISSIKEWSMPLIKFSTALLKKDGTFDNITDYEEIIFFIDSTLKLLCKYEIMDDLILDNLEIGIANLANSFDYKISNKYGVSPIDKKIINVSGMLVGETPKLEYVKLKELENLILGNDLYNKEVDLLSTFIKKYFPDKII
ncbi:hypothetical protein [Streptococcus uberis]|uniref:Uncharacterized protein n=3 Tax=Streptococcus uberis TaxID=1349 RepID=A0A6L6GB71_STRUB|nr:hypothetical protein [Streptococcus uberis]MTB35280.1 hypothetical protein [Streptococcus uberis]MTB37225.1 hypothetical protein [Streptococcus uberis]MTB60348.1 hypothetical protein [Streptococcus uberis]MTB77897.1 hypothetical protein [Streptococcus uberis]MTC85605.1 hypothetical protein [Streptococcus uberis]